MKENIIINQLPTRTWNRLGVNETALLWDIAETTDLGSDTVTAPQAEPIRFDIQGEGAYSCRTIQIEAPAKTSVTVFEIFHADRALAVDTKITAGESSVVRLVQISDTEEGSTLKNHMESDCEANSRIELIQIIAGKGDFYSDSYCALRGDGSSLKADIGYLGRKEQIIDLNLAVDQFGRKTESEINASGALKDSARKIFRGTIDFKKGSAGSVGNEQETVLMLGDDVSNKTVPLILCAEENVVGNHGATIGSLDDETLFYFESRGIGKETAEDILARAALERLARAAGDSEALAIVEKQLGGTENV